MRPQTKRALTWTGGVLGILVVAVALIIAFFDWNWLRGPLESRLSSATGKDVQIEGTIQGEYKWTPKIVIEGIKINEPDWKTDPLVGSIDRIEAVVELKKLLLGRLSIPSLNIIKPQARLERRGDKANWDIAQEANGPNSRHNVPLFGDITISDGMISYRDPDKHLSIDATLSVLKGNGGDSAQPFTLEGKGTYQKAPFTLKVTGDSLLVMREKSEPYHVDIKADLGKTHIIAGGTIADPIKMTGLAMGLQIKGDNAADLYPYLGIPAPATPPYQLGGTLDRYSRDVWAFRDFGGKVGVSDLGGALKFDLGQQRLIITGVLYSRMLNLADIGVAFGAPTKPAGNAPVAEHQKQVAANYARSDRMIPDAPLAIDAVRNADVDVLFTGAKVQAQDIPLERIEMRIKTDAGVMKLDPIQVGIAGGTMRGTVVIDARGDVVKSDSDLKFADFRLERFIHPEGNEEAAATGEIEGRVRFTGRGDSLRKALATSDGVASFVVANGSISKLIASLLGLDVPKALGVLISGDKKEDLRCIVSDFEIKDGIMTPRALVIDTSGTTVNGQGTINLKEESLDITLKGKPKKATLSLRGPIHVRGTFRDPSVGLGAEAYARAGASVVLGALLTPIAAIITFIDSGKKHDADCGGLEASAQQNAAAEPPVNKNPPPPKRTARAKAAPKTAAAAAPPTAPKAAPKTAQETQAHEQRPGGR